MTRDGLVDKNLSTGEETRVSQRGQDFSLRDNTPPEPLRPVDADARRPDRSRLPPSIRQHLQDYQQQAAEPRQEPDATSAYTQDAGPDNLPMEAARSHEALSHEAPAGPTPRQKQAAFDTHNATDAKHRTGEYETPPDTDKTPYSAENPQNTHQNATEETPDRLRFTEQTAPQQQPGRLQFAKLRPPAPTGAKPKQRGNQYQQQFNPDAAKPDGKAKPPTPDTPPPPAKPSRLQFSPDEQPPAPDKKLDKAQSRADNTAAKLDKAREKLPSKTHIKAERVYDDAKGKAKTKLRFEKEAIPLGEKKPTVPAQAGKAAGRSTVRAAANTIHQKIAEVEKENVGVESSHKLEQAAENLNRARRSAGSALRYVKERPYQRVAKLERKAAKANIRLNYRKALNDNPKLKSNVFSRMAQKRKIKREYAKAAQASAKKGAIAAKKTGAAIGKAGKALIVFVKSHPAVIGIIAGLLLLVFVISSMLSSCTNMAIGGLGAIFSSSHLSEDVDIDNAGIIYTEWETDLRLQIANAETDWPGYDEYRYDIGDIGHDPRVLMAYLTAKFQVFTFSEVESDLREIFDGQYRLEFSPEVEIRARTVTRTDPDTGEDYEDIEEYEWHILNIILTSSPFANIVLPRLSDDEREIFDLITDTGGNRQYAESPFAFNWLPYITSHYGWRIDPFTGVKAFHTGIDIGVPTGTEVIAAHDGIVSGTVWGSTGYGFQIVITGEKGLQTRYAHLNEILVSEGQEVKRGDVIGKVGSTGESTGLHLHYEVSVNGTVLNPIFFTQTSN
jgi:murein DD-endopeptidase MepM/ murein hydrolase activator NlpD